MIEHFEDRMWLGEPLNFHNICFIYPLTLAEYLAYSDVPADNGNGLTYDALFTPFIINHEFLQDAGVNYDGNMWDFFWLSADQLTRLVCSIQILTHTEDFEIDVDKRCFVFGEGKYLGADNFEEFSDIVLRAHCYGKYHHVERKTKTVDDFISPEAYERWKRFQANREKYQKKDDLSVAQCVKVIQLQSPSYIPASEILTWSYWKMLHWYNAVILQSNYTDLYSCFAHWGGKDLQKSLDSLKKDIMTKI